MFLVPPSLEALFQRLRDARHRDRRRARDPPAQCRDRAGPAGRLRPRRGQRGPARSSGPPPRSRRSSSRRSAATRSGGSASADDMPPTLGLDEGRPDGWSERPGEAASSRSPSTPRRTRPAHLHLRGPAGARGRRGRRGGARAVREGRPPGDRHRAGRGPPARGRRGTADRGPRPVRRAAAAAARAGARGGPRRPVPRAAGRRDPRDAAAGDAGAAGADGARSRRPARPGWDRARPACAPVDLDLLDELAGRARPVRDLAAPEGRAGLLRRLRALADEGLVDLTWTLLGAAVGPRYERRLWLTADGRAVGGQLAIGERPAGRPLGPASATRSPDLLGDERRGTGPGGRAGRGCRRAPRLVVARRPRAARPRARGGPRASPPSAGRPAARPAWRAAPRSSP